MGPWERTILDRDITLFSLQYKMNNFSIYISRVLRLAAYFPVPLSHLGKGWIVCGTTPIRLSYYY